MTPQYCSLLMAAVRSSSPKLLIPLVPTVIPSPCTSWHISWLWASFLHHGGAGNWTLPHRAMLDGPWTDLDSVAGLNGRMVLTSFLLIWDSCQVGRSPPYWRELQSCSCCHYLFWWLVERDLGSSRCFFRKDSDKLPGGVCLGDGAESRAPSLCLAWLGMNQCCAALLANATWHGKDLCF